MTSKLAITIVFNVILNAIGLIAVTVMMSYKCMGHTARSNWAEAMDYINKLNFTYNAQRDASTNSPARNLSGYGGRPRQSGKENRIIGGKPIGIRYVPSMAAMVILEHDLLPRDSFQCGATIIDKWWVVTAAHCIDILQKSGFTIDHVVIASGHRKWRLGRKHPVRSIIMHANFDEDRLNDDIALISVKTPFTGKYEIQAPVASSEYAYKPNQKVRVVGWGLISDDDGQAQEELRAVHIKLISSRNCKKLYGYEELSRSMICAGDLKGGQDACSFDSGGPLYDGDLIIGIVSWGIGCAEARQPGVYTNIGMFQKWILQKANKPKARTTFLKQP